MCELRGQVNVPGEPFLSFFCLTPVLTVPSCAGIHPLQQFALPWAVHHVLFLSLSPVPVVLASCICRVQLII